MRWSSRPLSILALAALCSSPALAVCPVSFPIDQGSGGGNIFTDPGRAYGGWFWMAGNGNNLLDFRSDETNIGTDHGTSGGVPLDSTPFGTSWLVDYIGGDGSTRMIMWDWGSAGSDGCGDLNGSGIADRTEVLAVLVVDSVGAEYAMISVGGNGIDTWDLSTVNNGVTSAMGTPGNGIPMTRVPEPHFGDVREVGGGRVEVEVLLPSIREIPTYDDAGGGRQMVQGFHLLVNDQLLAEALPGNPRVRVKANAGDRLVLRTVFGAPGDAGFFVDGMASVPSAGTAPGSRPEPADAGADADRDVPPAARDAAAGAAATGVTAGAGASGADADDPNADGDDDGVVNAEDNCPDVGNPDQEDADGDAVGDFCDLCPFEADEGQEDGDGDGLGDVCDACPQDAENLDSDGDGECDGTDNCPRSGNAGQEDGDGDGAGDVCDDAFDPFVVLVEPPAAKAMAGGSVAFAFAIDNRAPTTRPLELWIEVIDSKKKTTRVEAGPGCLEKVPTERALAPADGVEFDCTVPVPADAAKGAATIRVVARDKDYPDAPGEASIKLTIQ